MESYWQCDICSERHSPNAHELDRGELLYIQQLIEDGTITVPPQQLPLFPSK